LAEASKKGEFQPTDLNAAQKDKPRRGDGVPGYAGYIPNIIEDVYGATHQAAFRHHTGDASATARSRLKPNEMSPDMKASRSGKPGTGSATAAIMGYSGHIPGRKAENIIGRTFEAANRKAAEEFDTITEKKVAMKMDNASEGPQTTYWRRTSAPGIESRRNSGAAHGRNVPGYTGYIPGKHPESTAVVGLPFSNANDLANALNKFDRGHYQPSEGGTSYMYSESGSGYPRSARSGGKTPSVVSQGSRTSRASQQSGQKQKRNHDHPHSRRQEGMSGYLPRGR